MNSFDITTGVFDVGIENLNQRHEPSHGVGGAADKPFVQPLIESVLDLFGRGREIEGEVGEMKGLVGEGHAFGIVTDEEVEGRKVFRSDGALGANLESFGLEMEVDAGWEIIKFVSHPMNLSSRLEDEIEFFYVEKGVFTGSQVDQMRMQLHVFAIGIAGVMSDL